MHHIFGVHFLILNAKRVPSRIYHTKHNTNIHRSAARFQEDKHGEKKNYDMFPMLSAIDHHHDVDSKLPAPANNMLQGFPGYLMASFYPQMEAEAPGACGDGGTAAAAVDTTPIDRALVASKNHREAERRRRERIKSHLDRLRTILACDPKTDKASLLAKTVERVRDLKQQTADISQQMQLFPSETDEIIVLPSSGGGQRLLFQASLCCEDRSDLLPELIETLRSLRLTTLRAEISTLGGRVRNVLILAREKDEECDQEELRGGGFLRDALKALVDRPAVSGEHYCKRRRLVDRSLA